MLTRLYLTLWLSLDFSDSIWEYRHTSLCHPNPSEGIVFLQLTHEIRLHMEYVEDCYIQVQFSCAMFYSCVCMCVCVHLSGWTYIDVSVKIKWQLFRTVSLSTMWVLETKLKLLGLSAAAYSHWIVTIFLNTLLN